MSAAVEGIGEGSVSGETRGRITDCREDTRARILIKTLSELVPPSNRAPMSWKQRDKVLSAWLLALLGLDTKLGNAEFAEAAANSLCLPSPVCEGRV